MNPERLDHIASVIDYEGCIGASTRRTKQWRGFMVYVEVTNTNRRLAEKVARLTGLGTVYGPTKRSSNPRALPTFVWRLYGKEAQGLLEKLLPYLIQKG